VTAFSNSGLLRPKPAAQYCQSTESTFAKLRLTGRGSPYIKMGGKIFYDRADLDSWLASCRCTSTSAA
jgi:hypothetical protein